MYAPVRDHGFLTWDDTLYVTENPEVLAGLGWRGVQWAFTSGHAWNWHPLTWLSHMLDVHVHGLAAGRHHLTNVLLHVGNTLLLFGLLNHATGAIGRSAFVAAVFGVHPLSVESVAWVAERKNVLSGLFGMLALWAYVAYARRPARARYLMVLVPFVLGLMTKPTLVTLPFVLLLLDYWPLRRAPLGLRLVWEKMPLLALASASSVVTFVAQWSGGTVTDLGALPPLLRIQNALVSYALYVEKTLWPAGLAPFYPYPASFPTWQVAVAVLMLAGLSMVAWRTRRLGYPPVGWLWYVGTLVPVIGLVQVGNQALADRHTYLPLIGLLLTIAWGAHDALAGWRGRRVLLPIAAGLVITAFAVTARAQVAHWRHDAALWEHALAVTTANHVAHNNMGNVLVRQGRRDEAMAHYREAVRVRPGFALAHNNLGLALAQQGRVGDALERYAEALRLDPRYADAHHNLGLSLAKLGRLDEAVTHQAEAVRLEPDNAEARRSLGLALAARGSVDEAVVHLTEAVRLRPDDAVARHDLAGALARAGRADEAVAQYAEALRLRPDYALAHTNLGAVLAAQGRVAEAAAHYAEALRIDPGNERARRALDALSP